MDRLIGFVKVFNVVAGIVLVVGVIVIGWTIVQRSGSTALAPDQIELILPAGGRIVEMVPAADRVLLLIAMKDGRQQLLIIDPSRPEAITTVTVSDKQP